MNIEEVAHRVADIANRLRSSAVGVMALNALGSVLALVGFWRFGWGVLGVVVALVMLVPVLALWHFRRALLPVVELPVELAQRPAASEDISASLSNVSEAVMKTDRSVLGFAKTVKQLKDEVDVLRETDIGAVFDGLRAVQPARLSAAVGATALAFGALAFGGVVFAVGMVFG